MQQDIDRGSDLESQKVASDVVVGKDKRNLHRFVIAAITLLLAGIVIGYGANNNLSKSATDRTFDKSDGNNIALKGEIDIASLVSKVSPSVVSITTRSTTQTVFGLSEFEGAGTGIVVSKDGYILTNNHVIKGATAVGVVLFDGTSYDNVKVVGSDPLNDVAFLKIDGVTNLQPAEIGNSSSIRVGQQVVAIGNSLGRYQNTVTSGIISGTGRPISASAGDGVESLTDLLQTDAAINPGNSGGPLINMAGQVIGINTAIATDAQGIGFAIPINSIKGVLRVVLESGKVERAFLGVNYIMITPDVAKYYKLAEKQGAYVFSESGSAVSTGSPADKAGIKDKDVITKINDIEVGAGGSLSTLIGEYSPGDVVNLVVLRDGKEVALQATLVAFRDGQAKD